MGLRHGFGARNIRSFSMMRAHVSQLFASVPHRRLVAPLVFTFSLQLLLGHAGALSAPHVLVAAAPPAGVVGGGDFVHGVIDLDRSVEFYQQAFGLEVIASLPPGGPPVGKPVGDKRMQALTNNGGAFFRSATFRLPNSALTLTLIESTNAAPMPQGRVGMARPTDKGTSLLRLRVPDIDAALARIEATYEGEVVSAARTPTRGTPKQMVVRDRDGFLIELIESDATAGLGAAVVLTAVNAEAKVAFYRDILGFVLAAGEWDQSSGALASLGEAGGALRLTRGQIPGTPIPFEIREYRGVRQRHGVVTFCAQPGSAWLRVVVRDMDEMVTTLLREHVFIASAAVQPVLMDGVRHLMLRDPDGVFVELIEQSPKRSHSAE